MKINQWGLPKNKISQWNGLQIAPRTVSLQDNWTRECKKEPDARLFTKVKCNNEQQKTVRIAGRN